MNWHLVLSAVLVTSVYCVGVHTEHGMKYNQTIRMVNAVPTRPDDLQCTAKKLDSKEAYIIKIEPHASNLTAHHMMVYGCKEIPNDNLIWDCHLGESANSENSVCRGGERQILFAWAMDAPAKSLPEGVGIRVSGNTDIKYLVVQLHYASTFPDGKTDNSGVTLTMTHERPPMQAGYLILANTGLIPPQQSDFHMDSYCQYSHDYPIYPIGFRTHAHELGYVISGYRIREGKWLEIGRMSPQLPETFYSVSNPGMEIKQGDELVSRCTMNSMSRDEVTMIGTSHHEEMCNFYIMYATYHEDVLKTEYCFQNAQDFRLTDRYSAMDIPGDISSLKGVKDGAKVLGHFHMLEVV